MDQLRAAELLAACRWFKCLELWPAAACFHDPRGPSAPPSKYLDPHAATETNRPISRHQLPVRKMEKRADRSLPLGISWHKPCYRRAHAALSARASHTHQVDWLCNSFLLVCLRHQRGEAPCQHRNLGSRSILERTQSVGPSFGSTRVAAQVDRQSP